LARAILSAHHRQHQYFEKISYITDRQFGFLMHAMHVPRLVDQISTETLNGHFTAGVFISLFKGF